MLHMGLTNITSAKEDLLLKNYHTLLVEDPELKAIYKSRVDFNLISEQYKYNKIYYMSYDKIEKFVFPETSSSNYYSKMLQNDVELRNKILNLFNVEFSPCLHSDEVLSRQPKTFMIVCEWDARKDEGLIYAERLKKAGVSVEVSFYDNGFHGDILYETQVSKQMRSDLINYFKSHINA